MKDNPDKAAGYGGAATFFIFMYTAVFGATWLAIPWVYPTEVGIELHGFMRFSEILHCTDISS